MFFWKIFWVVGLLLLGTTKTYHLLDFERGEKIMKKKVMKATHSQEAYKSTPLIKSTYRKKRTDCTNKSTPLNKSTCWKNVEIRK